MNRSQLKHWVAVVLLCSLSAACESTPPKAEDASAWRSALSVPETNNVATKSEFDKLATSVNTNANKLDTYATKASLTEVENRLKAAYEQKVTDAQNAILELLKNDNVAQLIRNAKGASELLSEMQRKIDIQSLQTGARVDEYIRKLENVNAATVLHMKNQADRSRTSMDNLREFMESYNKATASYAEEIEKFNKKINEFNAQTAKLIEKSTSQLNNFETEAINTIQFATSNRLPDPIADLVQWLEVKEPDVQADKIEEKKREEWIRDFVTKDSESGKFSGRKDISDALKKLNPVQAMHFCLIYLKKHAFAEQKNADAVVELRKATVVSTILNDIMVGAAQKQFEGASAFASRNFLSFSDMPHEVSRQNAYAFINIVNLWNSKLHGVKNAAEFEKELATFYRAAAEAVSEINGESDNGGARPVEAGGEKKDIK